MSDYIASGSQTAVTNSPHNSLAMSDDNRIKAALAEIFEWKAPTRHENDIENHREIAQIKIDLTDDFSAMCNYVIIHIERIQKRNI